METQVILQLIHQPGIDMCPIGYPHHLLEKACMDLISRSVGQGVGNDVKSTAISDCAFAFNVH